MQEIVENRNSKLANSETSNGFTKFRLGAEIVKKIRPDGEGRDVELATVSIERAPLKSQRIK